MRILAFGIAKEIFGDASEEVAWHNGMTVAALKDELEAQYPRLKLLASYAIALNGEYAIEDAVINERDELAIIPPVSGG